MNTGKTFTAGVLNAPGAEPSTAGLDRERNLEPGKTFAGAEVMVATVGREASPPFPGLVLGCGNQRSAPVLSASLHLSPLPGPTPATPVVLRTIALGVSKSAIDFRAENKNVFIPQASP